MNVSLTKELEDLVSDKVATGRYHSASEVIREGLRLLEEHDLLRQARLSQLRNDIQIGIDQLDRGEGMSYMQASLGQLFDDLKAEARSKPNALVS
jgi:antitoxin ParD1/3/4